MDDAISRQAALDALNEQIEQCNKALGSFDISLKDEFAIKVERASLKAYKEQLENLPPVQPNHNAEVSKMEIVHCENCEYWDTSWETVYGLHYCPMIDMATKKNFFCKYGAEKEGEADGQN